MTAKKKSKSDSPRVPKAKSAWPTRRNLAGLPQFRLDYTIGWLTDYTAASWSRIKQASAPAEIDTGHGDTDDGLSTTAILPSDRGDAIAYLFCHTHVEGPKKEKVVHWGLNIHSRPKAAPPKDVVAGSAKVGGMQGLVALVRSFFEEGRVPEAHVNATLWVADSGEWKCRLVPQVVPPTSIIADLGANAKLEETGYRFEKPVDGLEEFVMTYRHEEKDFQLEFKLSCPLELSVGTSECIEIERGEYWTRALLSRFFEKIDIGHG